MLCAKVIVTEPRLHWNLIELLPGALHSAYNKNISNCCSYYIQLFYFQVDMPVFFYIDPEFVDDPRMEFVDEIVLSYTFFEAKEGMKLPVPTYAR